MATADDEDELQAMQIDSDELDALSFEESDSDDDVSDSGEPAPAVEWLVTGREKRSTAGNRMKSMIAAEDPDDDLELLFAEDTDDAGFEDAGDDGSDAQMSSSDDEDAQENADELEGEKELEKQARDSKLAARKRKAQAAIPLKFRKKVKIDTSQTPSASAANATPKPPRPKKKSERLSWLPSPADMPTRASKRETTMAGKEQLHKQMAERESKRLKQIEAMERKAKKMEALKKPPMTQAERLAEAALVEKRNAKSLNRWEEAEKQREEARKAKLAALNNRTLEGPVVTFWSGVGEWVDGKLKYVGKNVTIEDKPVKKKRHSLAGPGGAGETSHEAQAGEPDMPSSLGDTVTVGLGLSLSQQNGFNPQGDIEPPSNLEGSAALESKTPMINRGVEQTNQSTPASYMTSSALHTPQDEEATGHQQSSIPENSFQPQPLPSADIRPPDLKPPDLRPPAPGLYTSSIFALPQQPSLMKPPELKPNSFLAPPVGVSQNGLSMPVIGYQTPPNTMNTSNVLAPPNPAQRQPLLSMPPTNTQTPFPPVSTPARPTQLISTPASTTPSTPLTASGSHPPKLAMSTPKPAKANAQKNQAKSAGPSVPPSPPTSHPPAPANGRATRNGIILQNFNENAVRDKATQIRILFGREMSKLPKHGPATRCVITNHPAKYRDPKTGLPYYNAHAFRQIQKLYKGEYKWSSLVGAWMGSGTHAAKGVPLRFLNPDAPGPSKEQTPSDQHTSNDETAQVTDRTADHQDQSGEAVAPAHAPESNPMTATNSAADQSSAGDSTSVPTATNESVIAKEPSDTSQTQTPTTHAVFALNAEM